MKILYLHGLGSGGNSSTASALREIGIDVVSPTLLTENHNETLDKIKEIMKSHDFDYVVGTSMGGYYSLKISESFEVPCVAVNPAYEPRVMLQQFIGCENPPMNFETNEPIIFTQEMVEEFETLNPFPTSKVVIGENDELIPYKEQIDFCLNQGLDYKITNWGHRIEDAQELLDIIHSF